MSETQHPRGDSPSPKFEVEYPAAHSMDSTWFAIDKHGYVAQFNTGEAGAMPNDAAGGQDSDDDLETQIRTAMVSSGIKYDYQGRRRPGMHHVLSIFSGPGVGEGSLVFLKSLELVRDAIQEGRASQVESTSDYAVIWSRMTQEEYDRLEAAEQLVGLDSFFTYEGMPDSLAKNGVYIYGHTCENWIAGPYGREEVPTVPVHVDQLPPRARQQLKQCRLESISFATDVHIQPAEFLSCAAWGDRYLGLDGKQYSMDGSEIADDEDEDDTEEIGTA